LWPYKQELLEKYAEDREAQKKEEEEKKERKEKKKSKMSEMAKLALEAQQKESDFTTKQDLIEKEDDFGMKEMKQKSTSTSTKQKYYQEFKFVVEKSDVILFLLDARDPIGCRCPELEKTIQSSNPNVKIVLVRKLFKNIFRF
jgi:nuclear GTP-binding protein